MEPDLWVTESAILAELGLVMCQTRHFIRLRVLTCLFFAALFLRSDTGKLINLRFTTILQLCLTAMIPVNDLGWFLPMLRTTASHTDQCWPVHLAGGWGWGHAKVSEWRMIGACCVGARYTILTFQVNRPERREMNGGVDQTDTNLSTRPARKHDTHHGSLTCAVPFQADLTHTQTYQSTWR